MNAAVAAEESFFMGKDGQANPTSFVMLIGIGLAVVALIIVAMLWSRSKRKGKHGEESTPVQVEEKVFNFDEDVIYEAAETKTVS